MKIQDYNCLKEKEHFQFNHIMISEEEFYSLFVNSIFEDEYLYRYLTEFDVNDMVNYNIESEQIVDLLIGFIINLKKEYILQTVPIELRKQYCRTLNAKLNGKIIDVTQSDWEEKFETYLNNNLNGVDVIAEIILSKILEEKFNAEILISKLALTTNQNSKVFGIDTLHYSSNENALYLGESKFTNNVNLGVNQHKAELLLLDYKVKEEIKLMYTKIKTIRGNEEVKQKMLALSKKVIGTNKNIISLLEENEISKIYIAFFIMHGEEYDYDLVEEELNTLREHFNFENIQPIYITLPIISKLRIAEKIKEKIKEIKSNENS